MCLEVCLSEGHCLGVNAEIQSLPEQERNSSDRGLEMGGGGGKRDRPYYDSPPFYII